MSLTSHKISSLNPKWFKNNVAYTMAKYGMSFCVLGMSEEFKEDGIAVNALWPRTGKKLEPKLIPCLYKNPH